MLIKTAFERFEISLPSIVLIAINNFAPSEKVETICPQTRRKSLFERIKNDVALLLNFIVVDM